MLKSNYEAKNLISDSKGAVKHIILRVRRGHQEKMAGSTMNLFLVTLLLIGLTILGLWLLMKSKVLGAIESLSSMISKKGNLENLESQKAALPKELHPIYESVLFRDQVIEQNKEQLLEQAKFQIKSEVSEQVAHDVQSSIMILRDKLLSLSSNGKDEKIYKNALDDIEKLIGQLHENSESFMKEVDLESLLSDVVEMKKVEYRTGDQKVELKFKTNLDFAKVELNPTRFKFIISNLINNAKESYSPDKTAKISISLKKEDNSYLLSIKDNGCGISSKDLNKVFDRGVSLSKDSGRGLGLSGAKKVIENLKGSLNLESKLGSGTEVKIKIPAKLLGYQSTGEAPYDYVLVEDYKIIQMLWLEEAKEKGFSFATFSSPNEFIKNQKDVKKDAKIYLDSNFPGFKLKGEDWAKGIFADGFRNIWMCSSLEVETEGRPWLKGSALKNKPFGCVKKV